jgi:hypothetical protein
MLFTKAEKFTDRRDFACAGHTAYPTLSQERQEFSNVDFGNLFGIRDREVVLAEPNNELKNVGAIGTNGSCTTIPAFE